MGSCWKTIGLKVCCIPAPEQTKALLVLHVSGNTGEPQVFPRIFDTFPIFTVLPIPYCSLSPSYIPLPVYL